MFRCLAWFTRSALSPSLTSLSLSVVCSDMMFNEEDLRLFSNGAASSGIQDLSLDVCIEDHDSGRAEEHGSGREFLLFERASYFVRNVIASFPKVKGLSVRHSPQISFSDYTRQCPRLQVLCVDGPGHIDEIELDGLLERSRGGKTDLRELSITSYGLANEEGVKMDKSIGPTRVFWRHRRLGWN